MDDIKQSSVIPLGERIAAHIFAWVLVIAAFIICGTIFLCNSIYRVTLLTGAFIVSMTIITFGMPGLYICWAVGGALWLWLVYNGIVAGVTLLRMYIG